MKPARPSVTGSATRPTLPTLRSPGGTAYLFHFDPLGGWVSSTILNPDASVAHQWTEDSRKSVIEGVCKHFRGSFLPLLYAARLYGLDTDRIALRLGPAERKYDREVFADRLWQSVERAVRPNAWLSLAADHGHLPRWVAGGEEASEAVGVDRALVGRGGWQIEGELGEFRVSRPQVEGEPEELDENLLAYSVELKWGMVGPSRLPAISPTDFFPLVRAIGTGDPAERLKASEALTQLTLPCDEVPVLFELMGGQEEAVQINLLKTIWNALADQRQAGIETAREAAVAGFLRCLPVYTGSAAGLAGKFAGDLIGRVQRLKDNGRLMIEGLSFAGLATYAIPTGNDIDSLVLAAPRSRAAKEKLRTRKGLGRKLSRHTLLRRLRKLADPDEVAPAEEVKEVFRLLEGIGWDSIDTNREAAALIRKVLDKTGCKLKCTSCGREATLAVLPQKDMPGGSFKFYHGGRPGYTYHSGTSRLPHLALTGQPAGSGKKP